MNLLLEIFTDYTLRNVALGAAILGMIGGVLGSFAVLRKQSLIGDVLAHAALPGICLTFMLTGLKAPLALLLGAGITGWIASVFVLTVLRQTHLPEDAALGVTLSVFFGFGVLLLTFIQSSGDANQAGLDKFIFGQAATVIASDVLLMAVLGGVALLVVALLYKEFKLLSFDPEFLSALGFPTRSLGTLLTSLTVIAVLIGLQTVGVVLMAAMLIAPAAAARQWTDRLGVMIGLSALFGGASGVIGAVLSATRENLPTGPVVIVCVSVITFISILVAPRRGVIADVVRAGRNRVRIRLERLLLDAHVLHTHDALTPETLATRRRERPAQSLHGLRELEARGWARREGQRWELTPEADTQAHTLEASMRVSRPEPVPTPSEARHLAKGNP
jgi:manganese/zinc/iron transport system permease protein